MLKPGYLFTGSAVQSLAAGVYIAKEAKSWFLRRREDKMTPFVIKHPIVLFMLFLGVCLTTGLGFWFIFHPPIETKPAVSLPPTGTALPPPAAGSSSGPLTSGRKHALHIVSEAGRTTAMEGGAGNQQTVQGGHDNQQTVVPGKVDQHNEGGCNQQVVGGNNNTNNCGPPPLEITSTDEEKPSQDANHPFYRQFTVVPNFAWYPVSLDVACSAPIAAISPYGMLYMGDGYVYTSNPNVGHISEENQIAAGQAVMFGVFADTTFTCGKPTLSKTPRRRNAAEGPQ